MAYAMAKTDKIPQLELFKGHCKPIWLFLASGDNAENNNKGTTSNQPCGSRRRRRKQTEKPEQHDDEQ